MTPLQCVTNCLKQVNGIAEGGGETHKHKVYNRGSVEHEDKNANLGPLLGRKTFLFLNVTQVIASSYIVYFFIFQRMRQGDLLDIGLMKSGSDGETICYCSYDRAIFEAGSISNW